MAQDAFAEAMRKMAGLEPMQSSQAGQTKKRKRPTEVEASGVQLAKPKAYVTAHANSLVECGFAMHTGLIRLVNDTVCAGYNIGEDESRLCTECGSGPAGHSVRDVNGGDVPLPDARQAWLSLREARALGYSPGYACLEDALRAHASLMVPLLEGAKAAALRAGAAGQGKAGTPVHDWAAAVARYCDQACSLLFRYSTPPPQSNSSSASTVGDGGVDVVEVWGVESRDALLWVACVDAAVMDLFVGDASMIQAGSGGSGVPPPHIYMRTLVVPAVEEGAEAAFVKSSGASRGTHGPASNPLLEYLHLRNAEALGALQLSRLTASCIAVEGVSAGSQEGTMKGNDPVASPTVRAWWDACRDKVAAWAAFACPDSASASALASFAGSNGLVEVGAGTGYWAAYLPRQCPGLKVAAFDKRPAPSLADARISGRPPTPLLSNEYHGTLPAWAQTVMAGEAADIARAHARRTLFLCYPPPGSERYCMGTAAVHAYGGAGGYQIALVGEFRGDTGSSALEAALARGWGCTQVVQLPNWANTGACLSLWQKHPRPLAGLSTVVSAWPNACAVCGAEPNLKGPAGSILAGAGGDDGTEAGDKAVWCRDRVTRAVVCCSGACAASSRALAAINVALRERHLPPLRRGGTAGGGMHCHWELPERGKRPCQDKLVWRFIKALGEL